MRARVRGFKPFSKKPETIKRNRRRQEQKKREKMGYAVARSVVGDVKCASIVHASNSGLSQPGLFTDPGERGERIQSEQSSMRSSSKTSSSPSSSRTVKTCRLGESPIDPDCIKCCEEDPTILNESENNSDESEPPLMSESERDEWERLVGQRFLGMLKELFNVPGQRPVLHPDCSSNYP